jgi:hypothetical protein
MSVTLVTDSHYAPSLNIDQVIVSQSLLAVHNTSSPTSSSKRRTICDSQVFVYDLATQSGVNKGTLCQESHCRKQMFTSLEAQRSDEVLLPASGLVRKDQPEIAPAPETRWVG